MRIKLSDHFDYKRLIRYATSAICMMVFTSIYGMVDGFFVSNYCGKTPFAALNIIYPVIMVISTVGFMLGTGGSAVVARTLGEGRKDDAQHYFSMFVYADIVLGVTLTAAAQLLLPEISSMLGAEGEIFDYTIIYARTVLLSTPALTLQFMFQTFFNTAEKPKLGFYVTVLSGVANMILDYVYVGMLGMGIRGAALATVASEYIGGVIPLIYFALPNDSLLGLIKPSEVKFEARIFFHACWNGISEFFGNISAAVISIMYNMQLLRYSGEDGVSAFGVVMYVYLLFGAIQIGYSMATSPIVSFHYGARNMKEVHNVLKRSLIIIAVASVAMFAAAELMSGVIARIFVSYDQSLYELTHWAFRVTSVSYLFFGFGVYGSSFFTALGNGTISAIIEVSRLFIFQVLFLYTLPEFFGAAGIFYAFMLAESSGIIISGIFLVAMRKKYGY
ncbi:MAG: MATE family efflux transporter [Eubacterium sp.]|nr:MATE family efflux transporter [Eubacterium sp.]